MGEKGERPERVFPGRTDLWFIAAMVIVAGGLSTACIACFLSSVFRQEDLSKKSIGN